MSELSAAGVAATFAESTGEVPLYLIQFDHTDLTSPIRMVNNKEDIVSNGNIYTAFPFDIILPEQTPDRASTTTVRLCNVDRQVSTLLDGLSSRPTLTVSMVLASSPDTIELGPAEYEVIDYVYGSTTIEATLSYENVNEELIPAHTINPADFPGAF